RRPVVEHVADRADVLVAMEVEVALRARVAAHPGVRARDPQVEVAHLGDDRVDGGACIVHAPWWSNARELELHGGNPVAGVAGTELGYPRRSPAIRRAGRAASATVASVATAAADAL